MSASLCPPLALAFGAHRSIRGIAQETWDECFPGDPEAWRYYRAIESSGLASFSWVYFEVRDASRVLAVAPAFITDYRLDTTIQGRWKAALQPLLKPLRRVLTLRLLCLGSPVADKCHIGFVPGLPADSRAEVALRLLSGVDAYAAGHGIGLLAAKDVADAELHSGLGTAFKAAGYARQPGLPNAMLALPPGGEQAWLSSLSRAARRDVRRKLRDGGEVVVEERRGGEALDVVPELARLYDEQRARSGVDFDQFETLTPGYFREVFTNLGDAAVVFLYRHGGRLAGFNVCWCSPSLFVDKFIGFDAQLSRALNLYVVSWVNNVRYCAARDIPLLQSGQTAYAMKRHLGSELRPNWMFFRHRNPLVNIALRMAGPLLAADRYDEDLAPRSGHEK